MSSNPAVAVDKRIPNSPQGNVETKKKFKMPDIYIVLAIFILVMAAFTYIIPAGQYERQEKQTVHGTQKLVVAGTYHQIENNRLA